MKYIVGSRLLGLTNNSDEDYLEIKDGDYNFCYENKVDKIDTFYRSLENLAYVAEFKNEPKNLKFFWYQLTSYQLDKDIIGQDFPYEYHFLDYKDKYIELLKFCFKQQTGGVFFKDGVQFCKKRFYHIAYIYFMIKNNSPKITDEQKETIQKIHDEKMDVDFQLQLMYEVLSW